MKLNSLIKFLLAISGNTNALCKSDGPINSLLLGTDESGQYSVVLSDLDNPHHFSVKDSPLSGVHSIIPVSDIGSDALTTLPSVFHLRCYDTEAANESRPDALFQSWSFSNYLELSETVATLFCGDHPTLLKGCTFILVAAFPGGLELTLWSHAFNG